MEIIDSIITLIGHLAWPIFAIVAVIRFSPGINAVIQNFSHQLSPSRNIRAKLGGFEIESNEVVIKKEELEEIIEENSQEKRLELYKAKFDAESVIRKLNNKDLEWLRKFNEEYRIPNAFLVYPWGDTAKLEVDAYSKLEKLGLVQDYGAQLAGGEWIGVVTELGENILAMLKHEKPKANALGRQKAQLLRRYAFCRR